MVEFLEFKVQRRQTYSYTGADKFFSSTTVSHVQTDPKDFSITSMAGARNNQEELLWYPEINKS